MEKTAEILLSSGIPAVVSIIGFFITYFLNKRNIKEEVNKLRMNVQLEKTADLPYRIQELLKSLMETGANKANLARIEELLAVIFAYGSEDAIALAASMQELNYSLAANPHLEAHHDVIAHYILLLCQVKYDLTGVEINPQLWYRMRLKDYSKLKDSLDRATNAIVERLNLSPFLKIKAGTRVA